MKKFQHGIDLAAAIAFLVLAGKSFQANTDLSLALMGVAALFVKFAFSQDSLPPPPKV